MKQKPSCCGDPDRFLNFGEVCRECDWYLVCCDTIDEQRVIREVEKVNLANQIGDTACPFFQLPPEVLE